MRRTALKQIAVAGFGLTAFEALAEKPRKVDKRLVGTWRSDKERTTKLWKYKNELDAEKKIRFESIFGKLTRRYTATQLHTEYDGEKTSGQYWVVSSDARSVVLAYPEKSGIKLEQIFFEEDWFYILAGYNVEFFRRVEA